MSDRAHDLNRAFRRSPGVLSRDLGDGAVLLDLASGRYFELNATGMRIWNLLGEEAGPAGRLLERLKSEFEGSEDELTEDLVAILRELEEQGLVEPRA